jgi:hypothetical protein
MAGQLQTNPYLKTFDELQRSIKRMETYLKLNDDLLKDEEKATLRIMIDNMQQAILQIPVRYKVTKHFYSKKD